MMEELELMPINDKSSNIDIWNFFGTKYSDQDIYLDDWNLGRCRHFGSFMRNVGSDAIHDKLGIYFFFVNSRCIYIGMSGSIKKRLIQHYKSEQIPHDSYFYYSLCNQTDKPMNQRIRDVLDLEATLIKRFKPCLNLNHFC